MSPASDTGLLSAYRNFNLALESLYEEDLLRLAADENRPDFDDSAFSDAAGMVYNAGGFDASQLNSPEARRLIAETVKQLNTAISSGLPHEVPEVVKYALENNAFIFSGFKAFHTLREVGLSLTDDKGEIKPFETFSRDVEKVNNKYNHNYLYAEYNHAVGASQMAARWQQIEADGDRYDLQYRTAQDDRVREDHAILHGTTLPPSDPFWSQYLPPNGWNCRCTAVQVRRGKYPRTDPDLAMLRGNNCTEAAKQQIFRFNPGKELKLFPDKHPFYKAPEAAKQEVFHIARREAQKKAEPIICDSEVLQTGKLYMKHKAVGRALGHAFNQEELNNYYFVFANIERLEFLRHSPLGEGKDLTSTKDNKNIQKKISRGVTGYNVYRIEINGEYWQVKTEVFKQMTEAIYHIMKIKKE